MKIKLASLLLILPLLFTFGCKAPQLEPGGSYTDVTIYQADLAITTSYDVLHAYVTWEYKNRAALAEYPEIKESADRIRHDAKRWIGSATALREAYSSNPTPSNKVNLQSAINVLSAAVTEATTYMANTTSTGE